MTDDVLPIEDLIGGHLLAVCDLFGAENAEPFCRLIEYMIGESRLIDSVSAHIKRGGKRGKAYEGALFKAVQSLGFDEHAEPLCRLLLYMTRDAREPRAFEGDVSLIDLLESREARTMSIAKLRVSARESWEHAIGDEDGAPILATRN